MFHMWSDQGGGGDSGHGGFFSSPHHRVYHQQQYNRHKHAGKAKETVCQAIASRCSRTCLTKAWKNLAMAGIVTMHMGVMVAILSFKRVPILAAVTPAAEVIGVVMAMVGALCVIASVFVFRRQKRRLHPCMCLDKGVDRDDDVLLSDGDLYIPPNESYDHVTQINNVSTVTLQGHVTYDVASATLGDRDVSVKLTAPVRREAPQLSLAQAHVEQGDHAPGRWVFQNPAFEGKARSHGAKGQHPPQDVRAHYSLWHHNARPSLPVTRGQVDLEQLSMASLV